MLGSIADTRIDQFTVDANQLL